MSLYATVKISNIISLFVVLFLFTQCYRTEFLVHKTYKDGAFVCANVRALNSSTIYFPSCNIYHLLTDRISESGRHEVHVGYNFTKMEFKPLYFIENIDDIDFFDGLIFQLPKGYKLKSLGKTTKFVDVKIDEEIIPIMTVAVVNK